jgi:hypothetical protein
VARYHQGGVVNLEDPWWIGEVATAEVPRLSGDPGDLPAAAGLGQAAAGDQDGAYIGSWVLA